MALVSFGVLGSFGPVLIKIVPLPGPSGVIEVALVPVKYVKPGMGPVKYRLGFPVGILDLGNFGGA
jgi:hypothetical protein